MATPYASRRRSRPGAPGGAGRSGLVALGIVLVALAVGIPLYLLLGVAFSGRPSAPSLTVPVPAPLVSGATSTPPGMADQVLAASAGAIAQQLVDTMAARDWDGARRLLAAGKYADGDVRTTYPFLVSGNVAVLRTWRLTDDAVDLRAVLVLQEQQLSGPRTRALCARWVVDTRQRIVRVRSEKELANDRGTRPATELAERVGAECLDLVLR